MIRPHDLIDGKYEVIRPLGEGGMSRVWLARDFFLGKLWAVKEVDKVSGGSSPLELDCLMGEALLLKELDHPALPRVVEVLETTDSVLLVMDYVRGKPLSQVQREHGGIVDEAVVVTWGIELCEVLSYLHGQSPPIIYRDMKPSNVMLCDDGALRLIDFGIARVDGTSTYSGLRLGTRAFAAPEQLAEGGTCDARSDLYSLGKTLGRLAGVEATCGEGDASDSFVGVIRKATASDPLDRFQSAEEMERALRRCAKKGAVAPHEHGKRRWRRTVWLTAAVCALLGIVWLVQRIRFPKDEGASYEALLEDAQAMSREDTGGQESDAEHACRQAIEMDPSNAAAYLFLLREVYPDDAVFSLEEAARWEALAQGNAEGLVQCDQYPEICFEAGMLYYAFCGEGDNVRESARGAFWFEACSSALQERNEGGDQEEENTVLADQASAYAVICGFYRDLIVAREDGSERQIYRSYWYSLCRIMEQFGSGATSALGRTRDESVRLKLCGVVRAALESPAYLAGFARAGITNEEVDDLWAKALSLGEDAQASGALSEAERASWKEVQEATPRVRASEAAVFGA